MITQASEEKRALEVGRLISSRQHYWGVHIALRGLTPSPLLPAALCFPKVPNQDFVYLCYSELRHPITPLFVI